MAGHQEVRAEKSNSLDSRPHGKPLVRGAGIEAKKSREDTEMTFVYDATMTPVLAVFAD